MTKQGPRPPGIVAASVSVDPPVLAGAGASGTVTVVLSGPAPAGLKVTTAVFPPGNFSQPVDPSALALPTTTPAPAGAREVRVQIVRGSAALEPGPYMILAVVGIESIVATQVEVAP
jgi:hypothetical protein